MQPDYRMPPIPNFTYDVKICPSTNLRIRSASNPRKLGHPRELLEHLRKLLVDSELEFTIDSSSATVPKPLPYKKACLGWMMTASCANYA